MDFNEFRNRLEKDVGKIISDAYPGSTAVPKEVDKLQGQSYSALSISAKGSRLGMSLNMDSLYAQMQDGTDYADILQQAEQQSLAFLANAPDYAIPNITDYEAVKPNLYIEVVGTKRNAEMLANVPHAEMEDISMVCRIQIKGRSDEEASVLVTDSLMETLGVEKDRLLADALENAPQIRPAMVRGMGSVLGMLGGEEATDGQLVVVTTEDMVKGASAIFYPGMMDSASRMLKQDFFILPSSVHEVLLLPDDGVIRATELQSMVAEINAMAVDPVDQLTDNVYHYDAGERIFETGSRFEERRAAREAEQEKTASVLDELRSRQKENEMKPRAPHKTAAKEASL